jgi:hypothetical protein
VGLSTQESPGLEAKTVFAWLQREYPGRFSDGQIRTLEMADVLGMPLTKARNWTIGRPLTIPASVRKATGTGTREPIHLRQLGGIHVVQQPPNSHRREASLAEFIGKPHQIDILDVVEVLVRCKPSSALGGGSTHRLAYRSILPPLLRLRILYRRATGMLLGSSALPRFSALM